MNYIYYYDPIFGLQYREVQEEIVIFDISKLPMHAGTKVHEILERFREQGICFTNALVQYDADQFEPKILSNHFYSFVGSERVVEGE